MSTTTDVVAEALAAIAPYKLFIAARRKDADEEAAKVKGNGTPVLSLFDTGSPTPPPTETPAAEVVLPQPSGAAPTGSGTAMPPSASAMNTPEAELQAGATPLPTVPEAAPPTSSAVPSLDEETRGEAWATVVPTTATEALAQFDAAWSLSKPERLPLMVQEAYAQREEVPDMFAQLMVGAVAQGYFSPDLERAVTDLIRLDAHFQAAHVLFQDEQFVGLFEIAMQDGDYLAEGAVERADETSEEGAAERMDETPADGEADRAVERGEEPF